MDFFVPGPGKVREFYDWSKKFVEGLKSLGLGKLIAVFKNNFYAQGNRLLYPGHTKYVRDLGGGGIVFIISSVLLLVCS